MSSPESKDMSDSDSCESVIVITQSTVDSSTSSGTENNRNKWIYKTISNNDDWDLYFKKAQEESLFLNLSLNEHYDAWWKLMMNADKTPNKKGSLLLCIKEMVESIPVGTVCDHDSQWCRYIEGAYLLKRHMVFSDEEFDTASKLLEQKLSLTYSKPQAFWDTVRSCEQKYAHDEPELYLEKCLETYKKQFSNPYINMDGDLKKYRYFLINKKLDLNTHYDYSGVLDEIKKVTEDYLNCFEAKNHHVLFEEWIVNLLEKTPPQAMRAVALCEETVCDEMYSVCYHFILAKTLSSYVLCEIPDRKERLFKALKRGIHLGRQGCDDMLFYYLDFALGAASEFLTRVQAEELFNDIIEKISFDASQENYFASRKALIYGLKTLTENGMFPVSELQQKMVKLLKPVTNDGFSGYDIVEEEYSDFPNMEFKCFNLKRLALLCQYRLLKMTWKETLTSLENGIVNVKDPLVWVEYTNIVREHGSALDVEASYMNAIQQLKENDSSNSSYTTRRCIFDLHNKLREFVAIHGGVLDQIQFVSKLSKEQAKSSMVHQEAYHLNHCNQVYEDYYTFYISSIKNQTPCMELQQTENTEIPVTSQMQKLTVQSNTENKEGYPVFLSNVNFKATKGDIRSAFREKGLNVVNVSMGMNANTRQNFGFARVEFSSEEEAARVVREYDRINILGRQTFVSPYREKQPNVNISKLKKESTVLYISGLPEDWKDPLKFESFLCNFGHIKSVELLQQTGTIKVEYQMPEDASIGSLKIQEKFGDEIKIRKGYASLKGKAQKDKANNGNLKRRAIAPFTSNKKLPVLPDQSPPPKTQGVKRQFVAKTFYPQQLRQNMKKKLDVKSPDVEGTQDSLPGAHDDSLTSSDSSIIKISSEDSEDLSPPHEKKIKETPSSSREKLTNEDFRKMLYKTSSAATITKISSEDSEELNPPHEKKIKETPSSSRGKLSKEDFRKMLNKTSSAATITKISEDSEELNPPHEKKN